MSEDSMERSNMIEYFEQFIQYAVLKEVKEQQFEKISNEWTYFKQLLEKFQHDPQRIPIYLDILRKSKEGAAGNTSAAAQISNGQSPNLGQQLTTGIAQQPSTLQQRPQSDKNVSSGVSNGQFLTQSSNQPTNLVSGNGNIAASASSPLINPMSTPNLLGNNDYKMDRSSNSNYSNSQQGIGSPLQVQSPLITSSSVNGLGKNGSDALFLNKEQQSQSKTQYPNNVSFGKQQVPPINQNQAESLNLNSNNGGNSSNSGNNPITIQQQQLQILSQNQQNKRKESSEINTLQGTVLNIQTNNTNQPSTSLKPSPDQSLNLQHQSSTPYLSKGVLSNTSSSSSNVNLGSINQSASDQQQTLFQQLSSENQQIQFQKSINSTPVKVEPKSLFEEQKNKFRFQRDKIKSKVKSILNLFRENNIYLNKDELNDNSENLDFNGLLLNQQKQSALNLGLKKQASDGISSTLNRCSSNNLYTLQTPDITLSSTNPSSSNNTNNNQPKNIKPDQFQQQQLIMRNSSNGNINSQSIQNSVNTMNSITTSYQNTSGGSGPNGMINTNNQGDYYQQALQIGGTLVTSSNYSNTNNGVPNNNLKVNTYNNNQNTNSYPNSSNSFNNNTSNSNQQLQQTAQGNKRNVFTQQININSQNQQQSNTLPSN